MRRELWCQSGPSCGRSITSSSPWGVGGGGRGGRHVVWLLLNREDWRLRGLSGSEGQAGIKPKTPLKGLTVRSWVCELSVIWEVASSHKVYLHKRQFFCAGPPRPGLLPWAGTCRAGTCVCVWRGHQAPGWHPLCRELGHSRRRTSLTATPAPPPRDTQQHRLLSHFLSMLRV